MTSIAWFRGLVGGLVLANVVLIARVVFGPAPEPVPPAAPSDTPGDPARAGGLTLESSRVAAETDAFHTTIELTFNHDIDLDAILVFAEVFDQDNRPVSIQDVDPLPGTSGVRLVLEHLGGVERLTVRLQAGLPRADGRLSLGADAEVSLPLKRELRVEHLSASDHGGFIALSCQMSDSPELSELRRFIKIDPEVENLSFHVTRYQHLRIRGDFEPNQFYKVTFRAGLTGVNGYRLSRDQVLGAVTGELEPYAAFAAEGPFFPRFRSGGLPITVRNAAELRLGASRIYPNNYLGFYRDGSHTAYRNGADLGQITFQTGAGDDRGHVVEVPVATLFSGASNGFYRVWVEAGSGYRSSRDVLLTDLALAAVSVPGSVAVWVTSLADGRPVADCEIELRSFTDQRIGGAISDSDGMVVIPVDPAGGASGGRGPGVGAPYLIVATRGDDISVCGLTHVESQDLSAFTLPSRPMSAGAYEIFAYPNRGICRPGESMSVSALIRDRDLTGAGGFPVQLIVDDPLGKRFVDRMLELDESGFVTADIPFPTHAQSGRYSASFRLPGDDEVLGQCAFMVADYQPDRVRVSLRGDRPVVRRGEPIPVVIKAEYYFGKPLSEAPVKLEGTLSPADFAPDGWPGFRFGDAHRGWTKPSPVRAEAVTDARGEAGVVLSLPEDLSPGAAMRLTLLGSVQEPGGRAVSARDERVVHAYDRYIGLRSELTDPTPAPGSLPFEWISVDPEGGVAPLSGPLRFEVVRVEWRYLLREDESGNRRWEWLHQTVPVTAGDLPVPAGSARGAFEVTVADPGVYRLRVRTDEAGRTADTSLDFHVFHGDDPVRLSVPSYLAITPDRTAYAPGQSGNVTFDAPASGHALFMITGGDVEHRAVHRIERGRNALPFTAPNRPHGNVVASLTLVRDPTISVPLPRRFFGLANLAMNQSRHRIDTELTAPESTVPGESISLRLTLKREGKAVGGRVHLFAVDEGILALTAYRSPDPFDFFHGPRRVPVAFHDMFDLLFPEPDEGAPRVSPVGGGGAAYYDPFRPVPEGAALVTLPIVTVPESGEVAVPLTLPDHTGSMRLMAVAFNDRALGGTAREIRMRAPATLQLTAPRAVAPGDVFEATVAAFNHDVAADRASFSWNVEGPVDRIDAEENSVALPRGGTVAIVVPFKVRADEAGPIVLRCRMTLGDLERESRIRLRSRPASPPVYHSGFATVPPGETFVATIPDGFVPGTVRGEVRVGHSRVMELVGAGFWLNHYPYGCLEQTVSGAFPYLYLTELIGFDGLDDPAVDDGRLNEGTVAAAIDRLELMLADQGGFTMWPRGGEVWVAGSVYACHFLAEATRLGIPVPDFMWAGAKRFLGEVAMAGGDRGANSVERAYALYVLALAGEPRHALAQAALMDPSMPDFGRVLAAGSLTVGGRGRTGNAALRRLVEAGSFLTESISAGLDSPVRRNSLALLVLLDAEPGGQAAADAVDRLMTMRGSEGHWGTTQDNAMASLAIGRWLRHHPAPGATRGTVTVADQSPVTVAANAPFAAAITETGSDGWTITADGPGPLYCGWSIAGVPLRPKTGVIEKGLSVRRRYLDESGGPIGSELAHGDLVRVTVELHAPTQVRNLVVIDPLPGGLQIEDPALSTRWARPDSATGLQVNLAEKRDDRMVLFCDLDGGKQATFTYTARAVSRGEFVVPGVAAEAMYDPSLHAYRGSEGRLRVR